MQSIGTQPPFQRHWPLEGIYNLRDIGGYPTADGRSTRWRAVLRADNPHRLPADSQQALIKQGLTTVIDLRAESERSITPNVFGHSPQVKYWHLPLMEDAQMPQVLAMETLLEHNLLYLEQRQVQIQAILTAIAQSSGLTLIHCTVGKDRTGLIVALLLAIAAVRAETIAADYALSATYLSPLFGCLRAEMIATGQAQLLAENSYLLQSVPQTMLDTLAYLDKSYGSVRNYLQAIGLTPVHLRDLEAKLVEKEAIAPSSFS